MPKRLYRDTNGVLQPIITVGGLTDSTITSTELVDGTIVLADIADGAITNAKVNNSAGIVASKLNGVTTPTSTEEMSNKTLDGVTIKDATNVVLSGTTGTKIGTATSQKLAFYNSTPVVKPTALTTVETSLTFVNENTPDFALSSLTTTSSAGFATLDEAQAFVEVVANMQIRIGELETKLQALGLLA